MADDSDDTFPIPRCRLSDQELAAVESIETILLPLGPYRNLTTLIGAIFGLHPQAVVLNHAALRILPRPELDFLRNCTPAVQKRFLEASVRLLQAGERGPLGGSILKSHAFDDPVMKGLYEHQYGATALKPAPRVLYWKDSQRIQNHLLATNAGIERVTEAFTNVKFILPIRNPIDCAKSNLNSGHWPWMATRECATFAHLVAQTLANIRRLYLHPALTPDRMLVIWQSELTAQALPEICDFCRLERDPWWLDCVPGSVKIRERPVTRDEQALYVREVDRRFHDLPALHARLLRFAATG